MGGRSGAQFCLSMKKVNGLHGGRNFMKSLIDVKNFRLAEKNACLADGFRSLSSGNGRLVALLVTERY
ncbi:hypothetical protein AJ87_09195 [Rhizobium yanglingense]|nr:hypothetical protein AJ87_09195 [Rhizobium yanglingense]